MWRVGDTTIEMCQSLQCHDPVQQIREIEQETTWKDLPGQSTPSVPETPSVPNVIPPFSTPSEDDVECIVQEVGDAIVSYILMHKGSTPQQRGF